MPSQSSTPWIAPSSPKRPCSALNTASGCGVQRGDDGGEVVAHLDRGHVEAGFAQGGDDLDAGGQADLAFGGDAAVEDRDAAS